MESWTDQGIVLSARAHGEGGAIVALLTENNGRHAGYLHGAQSKAKRSMLEPGSHVKAEWRSRVSDNLGSYALEPLGGLPAGILDEPLKLSALLSACALCDAALPEREGHPGLYHGLLELMNAMESEFWAVSYVMWEIALLRELGFRLELDKCAAKGDPQTLTHVSPKSGRAVSQKEAEPYQDKLLKLPNFLRSESMREGDVADNHDILLGIIMTHHFLENWAFNHHSKGVPEARLIFQQRLETMAEESEQS
ncbi:MAG: DNA repair protein RecO [Pseudomonadota bacterium]